MNVKLLSLLTLSTVVLAACGGGGGGEDPSPESGAQSCGASPQSQVWLNHRVGCVAAGDRAWDAGAGAYGSGDSSYTIDEEALGSNGLNILDRNSATASRSFAGLVCLRHRAPTSSVPLAVGDGLVTTFKLGNPMFGANANWPTDVTIVTLDVRDGVATTCDAAVHPIIIDAQTGLVVSVNAAALSHVVVTDNP
jgi:hypothetical protein